MSLGLSSRAEDEASGLAAGYGGVGGLADSMRRLRDEAAAELLRRREDGVWRGRLSSSALSTALATFTLTEASSLGLDDHVGEVGAGLRWLVCHQNQDGGYGDTVRSRSNLPTTLLVWAALRGCLDRGAVATESRAAVEDCTLRAAGWIEGRIGGLGSADLENAILDLYGEDRTFSVPILTFCALAGVLDVDAWRRMPRLPFELAVLPRALFRFVGLPVVSYALPALIAIGRVQLHHTSDGGGRFRAWLLPRAMKRLASILPESGGFLEAIPLTAFVTVSLLRSGAAEHEVTTRCLGFLRAALRRGEAEGDPDGAGWAIDIELGTWVSSLSVEALVSADRLDSLSPPDRQVLREWFLGQQWRRVHPFTGAAPGGWAWTDLPGGVPDADDTPGALLALRALEGDTKPAVEIRDAAEAALRWLADLQNRDGGIPTFCRGWAKLPFDRSTPDLTAHTLRAFAAWGQATSSALQRRIARARRRALGYLARQQRDDGAWLPLWFGNEAVAENANPVYGTARVLRALATDPTDEAVRRMAERGAAYLLEAQADDGGWGGAAETAASVEETSLTLDALAAWTQVAGRPAPEGLEEAIERGCRWLTAAWDEGAWRRATPIGFYFANLWYYEDLYPLIFTVAAAGSVVSYSEAVIASS
ncbi:MAG: squalene--hopene cyclase [Thermoanaerobaculia bacterium]|nr:squalene--hopene cyclase [Thermoanaerobaculia bacterium]